MEIKSPKSIIKVARLLVSSLFFVFALYETASSNVEPTGANVNTVQFDAIIELNRYYPHSLRHDYTMMFARYWVARNYYSAAIVWAEPQSTDLFFAINPPSLSFASGEKEFIVRHELNTKHNQTYKKPLSQRGVFRHKFGGYPIDNIRFAEREALDERIYAKDIGGLDDVNQTAGEVLDISIPAAEGGDARDVSKLKLQTSGERIDSMQLFNADKELLKDISYEYENIGGKNCLRKLTAVLPERPMMVGFNVGGMKVTLDGKEYRYRDLQATHHSGGRSCTVEYEPVRLGCKEVTLPVKVTVRNRKEGRILRRVRMMNFKQFELDSTGADEAARRFGESTADQHEYEQLRIKYWKKNPNEIEKKDAESIEQLRGRFEKALVAAEKSTGEKLKYLNILMELNLILGEQSELERYYQSYLSTLSDSKLFEMTPVGGYGVIEKAMLRGSRNAAGKLLERWVDTVLEINDAESILLFAKRQLAKNRLWTTVKLLESFSAKYHSRVDTRFEADVLKCTALGELCKLLRSGDIAKKGLIAKVQADWVSSIGMDNLEKMLDDSMAQAKRSFTELNQPTREHKVLRAQLEKVNPGTQNAEVNDTNDIH